MVPLRLFLSISIEGTELDLLLIILDYQTLSAMTNMRSMKVFYHNYLILQFNLDIPFNSSLLENKILLYYSV